MRLALRGSAFFPRRLYNPPLQNLAAFSVHASQATSAAYPEQLLTAVLSGYLAPYWEKTPSAEAAISQVEAWLPEAEVGFDHFAFRSYGIGSVGISSIAQWFLDLGYTDGGALNFEKKKLRARWYKPPSPELPRIFVSELKVEEMSAKTQSIINKYAGVGVPGSTALGKYGLVTGFLGVTPWPAPSLEEYQTLAEESEYAAWVLVNGYALNHTTIAVHRLAGFEGGIEALNKYLKEQGLKLSQEGGETKVSLDGLLLQSSTIADGMEFTFEGGESLIVPGSYVEFAERLVLPEYASLKPEEVEEWHRRDGFEAASADKIFESTTAAARELGTFSKDNK